MTFGLAAFEFYNALECPVNLPLDVVPLNCYESDDVMGYVRAFLSKYFDDCRERILVFGINPGRFGGAVTGISFTDPVALERYCGIPNDLVKRRELSSDFVYRFIDAWGGVGDFYSHFFLTGVCPIGFTRHGKNFNFYENAAFYSIVEPYVLECVHSQLSFGARRDVAIVIGSGSNRKIFEKINSEYKFFDTTCYLPHPRFIMQYHRKELDRYLKEYCQMFSAALSTA